MLVTATVDPTSGATTLQFEGAETPPRFAPKRVPEAALLAEAKTRLDALQASDEVAGAFLVARNGEVRMQWQGGLADRQRALAVSPDTRFRLASLNKMFTAVAILQLEQAGRYVVFMRLQSRSSQTLDVSAWDTVTYLQSRQHKRLFDGIVYGILFALLVYNLVLAYVFRHDSYGLYVLTCAAALFTLASFNGHAAHYLLGDWPWWQQRSNMLGSALWILFGAFAYEMGARMFAFSLWAMFLAQRFWARLHDHRVWIVGIGVAAFLSSIVLFYFLPKQNLAFHYSISSDV